MRSEPLGPSRGQADFVRPEPGPARPHNPGPRDRFQRSAERRIFRHFPIRPDQGELWRPRVHRPGPADLPSRRAASGDDVATLSEHRADDLAVTGGTVHVLRVAAAACLLVGVVACNPEDAPRDAPPTSVVTTANQATPSAPASTTPAESPPSGTPRLPSVSPTRPRTVETLDVPLGLPLQRRAVARLCERPVVPSRRAGQS
jgi:hypothetical protein